MSGQLARVGLAVLGACAQASAPGSGLPPDASGKVDAPRSIDSSLPTADAPAADMCASAATCTAAVNLGGVSGDTGEDMLMASGYQAAWYSVRVTENDSGVFGVPQELLTELTSPASEMYDLFVYVNTGSDVIDCTSATGSIMVSGTTESSSLTWGETGTFSNGNDDSRTVSIQIVPKAGTCSPASPWQLVVYGDLWLSPVSPAGTRSRAGAEWLGRR